MDGKQLMTAALATLLACTSALADLAPPPQNLPVTVAPSAGTTQQNASLKLGQHLLVHLPAQLGMGFDWALTSDAAPLLKALGSRVSSSGPGTPGGFQTQEFEFVAQKAGSVNLVFAYRQPWRSDLPPAKTFALGVTIGGPA